MFHEYGNEVNSQATLRQALVPFFPEPWEIGPVDPMLVLGEWAVRFSLRHQQGIWTFKTAGNLATTRVTGRTFPSHHDIFALVRLRTPASLINIKTLGGEYCS